MHTPYEYPENFARFYDVIYHRLRSAVDLKFFMREIGNTKGKVLEIGAGTGRLFVEALRSGADVYALDASDSMLKVLKSKLDEKQRFRVSKQDFTGFRYDFKFDLALAPFRVIQHLTGKEDQLMAINKVYDHLNPGGRFIFDTFIPDLQMLTGGIHEQVDFDGEYEPGKKLKRSVTSIPDLLTQTLQIRFHLEWDEAGERKQEDWNLQLRYFFRYELEHLVERSKFKEYKILGDYEGNELNENSRDLIMVCRK